MYRTNSALKLFFSKTSELYTKALQRHHFVKVPNNDILSHPLLTHPHVYLRTLGSLALKWNSCVRTGNQCFSSKPATSIPSQNAETYVQKQDKVFFRPYCTASSPKKLKSEPTNGTPNVPSKSNDQQKKVQPLSSKRVGRRRKGQSSQDNSQELFDVTAYAPSEDIDLESLVQELNRHGLYSVVPFPTDTEDVDDCLHVEAKYKVDNQAREIFFFRDGALVFWNMPEEERHNVMKFIRQHQDQSYDPALVEEEVEHMKARYVDAVTQLVGDEIQLESQENSSTEAKSNQLEKYSFSNALALSVKLSIWEASLETYVDSIAYILEELKEGKKLKISRQEVLRKTGEVLTLRHLINLSSDLLDVPDFYWDRDKLEALYRKTCQQHSIGRRVKVMNEKLNHCYELTGLLREHLSDKHHTYLEKLIIFLIAVEVIFEIFKMVY